MVKLQRSLGLFDVVSLAIGGIIGAGIFVITGFAFQVAGPALLLSILIAGLVTIFTSLSVVNLVNAFPKEGGEYEFGYKTLSPFFGFLAGWMWTVDKIVGAGVLALGFSTYLSLFFPFLPLKLIGVALIATVTAINYRGISLAGDVIDLFVVAKVLVLLFFIGLGISFIKPNNFFPFAPQGVGGILQAAGIIFFAYVGFARPIYLVEEIKNPKKNVSRGIFLGLAISIIIYLSVTFVAVGLIGSSFGQTNSPLAAAIASTGISWSPVIIILGALIAIFSVILDDNLGLSRMIFAMSRKDDYPKWFSKIEKSDRAPARSIILTGIITAFLTLFFDLRNLVEVASFFILLYFVLANLSAVRLKKHLRKFPAVISVFGIFGTLALAFSLSFSTILIGFILIFVGILYFYFKKKIKISK